MTLHLYKLSFTEGCLVSSLVEFHRVFLENRKHVKSLHTDWQTDRRSEKLTWAFSLGELKRRSIDLELIDLGVCKDGYVKCNYREIQFCLKYVPDLVCYSQAIAQRNLYVSYFARLSGLQLYHLKLCTFCSFVCQFLWHSGMDSGSEDRTNLEISWWIFSFGCISY